MAVTPVYLKESIALVVRGHEPMYRLSIILVEYIAVCVVLDTRNCRNGSPQVFIPQRNNHLDDLTLPKLAGALGVGVEA